MLPAATAQEQKAKETRSIDFWHPAASASTGNEPRSAVAGAREDTDNGHVKLDCLTVFLYLSPFGKWPRTCHGGFYSGQTPSLRRKRAGGLPL